MNFLNQIPLFLTARLVEGTEQYDPATQRRLIVTNALAYLVAVMTIPYQVFYALWDLSALWLAILVFAPQVLLYALVPKFHRFGPNVAPAYLVTVWITFAMLFSYFFSTQSGLHFYFLPGATAGVLVFGARQWLHSTFTMLLGVAGFLIAITYFQEPAPFISVSETFLNIMFYLTIPFAFIVVFGIVFYANYQVLKAEDLLQSEFKRSERLLYNVLPRAIASELKDKPQETLAKEHDSVSILFADIVDFTPRASKLSPSELVEFLNKIFTEFDELATKFGLEKIKTIGDAFMVAGGMPLQQPDHAERVARMGIAMLETMESLSKDFGEEIMVRIGMNTGPVVAGVIGNQKMFYDVWGDTVNTAARMESYGRSGKIQVTARVKDLLADIFDFEKRGIVDVKGIGKVEVWFLMPRQSQIPIAAE